MSHWKAYIYKLQLATQTVSDHQEAQAPVPKDNYSAEFEAARLNENKRLDENYFGLRE